MNHKYYLLVFAFFLFSMGFASAKSLSLDGTGEVSVNDDNSLDGFSEATWNVWINQEDYNQNAGIVGKYQAVAGGRSYLIRTSLSNGNSVSVHLSSDGVHTETYTSASSEKCAIRSDGEWVMITVTFDGNYVKYYRNGEFCDEDVTNLNSIHNSGSPLRLGGGNSVYFNGGIDDFTFYDKSLSEIQIKRLYDESVYGNNLGQSIPVLAYHQVKETSNDKYTTTTQKFEEQMDYLEQNGFETITMKDFYDWRNGNFEMPEKPIMISFDDGYMSVYTNAKPIMDEHDFVATVGVVTRYASFTGNNTGYMKWAHINGLIDDGWDAQSHSLTHAHMLSLSESQFREQLSQSKIIIENKTGLTSTSFIFPYHESNQDYTEICGEYYGLCWTQGSFANPAYNFKSTDGKSYESLRRINVFNEMTIERFADYLRKDTDKIGEWKFEEGSGTTTEDTSGNSNDGQLLGGVSWVD